MGSSPVGGMTQMPSSTDFNLNTITTAQPQSKHASGEMQDTIHNATFQQKQSLSNVLLPTPMYETKII
jgi:hypothetical protein